MRPIPEQSEQLTEQSQRLNEAIERYLTALEAGERPDAQDLIQEFPEVADELAEQLQGLDFIHRVAPQLRDSKEGRTHHEAIASLTTLGDFRILRELGRGGMGVVYEAEQLSIGRRVALKVLPFAAMLDPRQLKRFKNEARAAGALHHPHIVPVFSVGCERGVHYYAMQLIDAVSLAEVLEGLETADAELPTSREAEESQDEASVSSDSEQNSTAREAIAAKASSISREGDTRREIQAAVSTTRSHSIGDYFRLVAEWGMQAAEALAYAHENGVVHRDVKPSNLLLDEAGQLWVTDFGLARIEQDPSMTFTGDVVGTLRYMSPEQATGKRVLVDHRTDVYSLGATLYELLTFTPVFSSRDRQQLLHKIASDEPVPLRRRQPNLPIDLETIVRKSLAKDADGRYTSAQDLADDLRSFLADRPILARPPTLLQRCGRLVKRHQTVAAATAILLVLATIGLSISVAAVSRQRDKAERAHKAAAQNLALARSAVDGLVTRVAENDLLHAPRMERVREELLQEAADFYEQAINVESDDPELDLARALAYERLGRVHLELNERERSLEEHATAVSKLRELHHEYPGDVRYAAAFAASLRTYAQSLEKMSFVKRNEDLARKATESLTEAVDILGQLTESHPDRIDFKQQLIESYLVGYELYLAGITSFLEGRELWPLLPMSEEVLASSPDDPEKRHLHARLLAAVADGGAWKRKSRYNESIRILEELVSQYPDVAKYRRSLAGSIWNKLNHVSPNGSPQIVADRRRVVDIFEELSEDFPNLPEYRAELANARHHLAMSLQQVDHAATVEQYQKAEQLLLALIEENPEFNDYYNRLSFVYGAFAQYLQQDANDPRLLVDVLQRELQFFRRWPERKGNSAVLQGTLSHALIDVGRFDEGIDLCYKSLSMLESKWTTFEKICRWAAEKLSRAGRHEDAAALCDQLIAKRKDIVKQSSSEDPSHDVTLGRSQAFAARIYLAAGRSAEAFELARDGIKNQDFAGSDQRNPDDVVRWCALLGEEFYAAGYGEFAKAMFEMQFELCGRESLTSAAPVQASAALMWARLTSPFPDHWSAQESLDLAQAEGWTSTDSADRRVYRTLALAQYRVGQYHESLATLDAWMNSAGGSKWARGIEWFLSAMNRWQLGEEAEARRWQAKAVRWMIDEASFERKVANVVFSLGLGDRYAVKDGLWFDNRPPMPVNGDGERHTLSFFLDRLQQEADQLDAAHSKTISGSLPGPTSRRRG